MNTLNRIALSWQREHVMCGEQDVNKMFVMLLPSSLGMAVTFVAMLPAE